MNASSPATAYWDFDLAKTFSRSHLVSVIQAVFRDGFERTTDWATKGVHAQIDSAALVGLLCVSGESSPQGYCIYALATLAPISGTLLWENSFPGYLGRSPT